MLSMFKGQFYVYSCLRHLLWNWVFWYILYYGLILSTPHDTGAPHSCMMMQKVPSLISTLGPVVQSVLSLTSSLRVISLTVLADSIYNILIFFAEKM